MVNLLLSSLSLNLRTSPAMKYKGSAKFYLTFQEVTDFLEPLIPGVICQLVISAFILNKNKERTE